MRKEGEKEWKKEEKRKTIDVKKMVKEQEIWNKEAEAAKLEKEAKKLISCQMQFIPHYLRSGRVSQKFKTK